MKKIGTIPTEKDEQITFCKWLDLKKIPYNATPNGGLRDKITASSLKKEGVKAGFPDLTIFLPHKIIYIEMKRQKGGVVSPLQKQWGLVLDGLPYASFYVCCGFSEAVKVVECEVMQLS